MFFGYYIEFVEDEYFDFVIDFFIYVGDVVYGQCFWQDYLFCVEGFYEKVDCFGIGC